MSPTQPAGRLRDVDRATALSKLPQAYEDALRLRDQGLGETALAAALGMEPEAVANLVRLAEAKLSRLLQQAEE